MKADAKGRARLTHFESAAILSGLSPRFFEGLEPGEVREILAAASRRRFPANSVITREGDPATHLYLMLDGSARHYTASPQGEKIVIRWIPPGDVVGGAAFLSKPVEYIVSTEAVKNSSALVWDRATVRSFGAKYSRLMENALLIAYDYVVLYKIMHIAASCQSAPQRLAQVLGSLARGMGHRVAGGVELYVRNEELANEANMTIFTVSRLMGEWQRQGLLVKSRGKVVLRLPEKLIQMEA
jgi:CRP/FNR family transcriptional regulator, nitrogen oxide reductase regulator